MPAHCACISPDERPSCCHKSNAQQTLSSATRRLRKLLISDIVIYDLQITKYPQLRQLYHEIIVMFR